MPDDPRQQDQRSDPERTTPHPRGEQSRPADSRGAGSGEAAIIFRRQMPIPDELPTRKETVETLLAEAKAQEEFNEQAYDARVEQNNEARKQAAEKAKEEYDPEKLREDAKKLNEAEAPDKVKEQAKAIQELRAKKYPQPNQGGAAGGNAHA